jgi:hypothetical protein
MVRVYAMRRELSNTSIIDTFIDFRFICIKKLLCRKKLIMNMFLSIYKHTIVKV